MGVHKKIISFICCLVLVTTSFVSVLADDSEVTTEATTVATTEAVTTATPSTEKVTTTEKPSTTTTTADDPATTTAKKKKTKKKKKDKKDKNSNENISAPEKKVSKASSIAKKDGDRVRRQIKRLESEKFQLENTTKMQEGIKALYERLEKVSQETALPLEVLLTGVHTENTITGEFDVNPEIAKLAVQGDSYLALCLKDFNFGVEGGTSIVNTLKQDEVVQLKPYLDKVLRQASLTSEEREVEIVKVNRELKKAKARYKAINPNKERVFNPKNLLEVSNLTASEIKEMLKGTALESLASAFYKCEREYKVNAVAIMSIAIHESGWGTSRRAREDNNLTGYGVTSDSAKGINADTKEGNLLMTAKLLKEKYLVPGSAYYHKAPSIIGVNYHYCVGNTWAGAVTNQGYNLMKRLP